MRKSRKLRLLSCTTCAGAVAEANVDCHTLILFTIVHFHGQLGQWYYKPLKSRKTFVLSLLPIVFLTMDNSIYKIVASGVL